MDVNSLSTLCAILKSLENKKISTPEKQIFLTWKLYFPA